MIQKLFKKKQKSDLELFEEYCNSNLKIPFGKYKGKLIEEIDWDYLYWFKNEVKGCQDIKDKIEKVIGKYKPARRTFVVPSKMMSALDDILYKHHGHSLEDLDDYFDCEETYYGER